MKILMILILLCTLSFNVLANEKELENKFFDNFGFNFGFGTSFVSEGKFYQDICFHAGINYFLDENWSMIGFRYHKLNFNKEFHSNIFPDIPVHIDLDFDAYYLYYRYPAQNFTFSLGTGIFNVSGVSYLAGVCDVGYLNNLRDNWGYEIAATTFYLNKNDRLYFYIHGGLWVTL